MYVGGLFCFSLLFLLTFRQMEVLFSVQKPQHFIFSLFGFFFFFFKFSHLLTPTKNVHTNNSLYHLFRLKLLAQLFCPGESGFTLPGAPEPLGSGLGSALS